ncbi:hypothetical protein BD780_002718 [Clostridium tetanomorphum]|uniref:ABC-2 family transporter protein n=1 Tax=Clostridium tetanomorphum TaxID=1553 RepID=A0A923J2T3_CLOTT|nr:hypothetical protein [Clostridium tetanomorphum]KAJ50592.1 hypothetical protein CTM_16647 [Clostridium tetanomorphum DSM 665]MBC2399053.1 hypothetical protein [Clostridium tetanomorphum]MBP1862666.1 hypothetical protein [Clostridium tetanomorphum]NRS85493.1 hypothetical protein [Clostridium tetanomorphum]NRZ98607.1 hypothetical protein [Clostridium tetanomorphum]
MSNFKKEFKNILKKPLYWLFICVIVLVYTTEVIPAIKIYGPEGKNMDFSTACEKTTMDMAYQNTKWIYKNQCIIFDKRLLGFNIDYKKVDIDKGTKEKLKNMLDQFDKGQITYTKYRSDIDDICKKLQKPKEGIFSYTYSYLYCEKPLNTQENYIKFRKEIDDVMKNMSFSKYTATFFADILGITISVFPIFLIGFLYKKRRTNLVSYYFAMCFNLVLFSIILAGVTYGVSVNIANLYGWSVNITDFLNPVFIWIIPTILYSIAEMMLLSLFVKNGYIAVAIQFVYVITAMSFDINLSSFVIRWNYYLYSGYVNELNNYSSIIYYNRLLYMLIASVFVYIIHKMNCSRSLK